MKVKTQFLSVLVLVLFSISSPAWANRGREVMEVQDKMDNGFHDEESTMEMTLINAHGEKNIRKMTNKSFEMKDDGDKSLIKFEKPKDIKGTSLLTFEHRVGDDDQWLYLPALKRVKRISSRNKSGSFMGSEFSYEDISSFEVEKYTYKFIKEDTLDGVPCFVVERYPVDKNSGYTKQVTYVRKDNHQFKQIDYYDRKGDLLKIAYHADYKQLSGKFWRPTQIHMKNVQTKKETVLDFMGTKIGVDLKEADFTKRALKKR